MTDKQLIIAVLRELEAIFDKAWVSTSYEDEVNTALPLDTSQLLYKWVLTSYEDKVDALKRQIAERIKQLEQVGGVIDYGMLEQFKLVLYTYINEAMAEDFAEPTEVNVSSTLESWADEMVAVQIKQAIYGRQAGKWTYRYPRDWWQMLKQSHTPYWFRKRWPVRTSEVVIDVKLLYPNGKDQIVNVTAYRDGGELWLEPLET